jgi:predicted GNAT superfamily acetyltransferase
MTPQTEKTIEIRQITTIAEMRKVEELQTEVWKVPEIEIVPYSHLAAAVTAGGVLIGAFDEQTLVGFVYGFVSFEKGQTAHHSHLLAVKPEYRNYKLGEKLKNAQREFVQKQGISMISWTFDPLQSINAYFNFSKLGVVSDTYFVDFYGDDAPSFLHRNSTDRLWVFWHLNEEKKICEIDLENIKRLVNFDKNKAPQIFEIEATDQQLAIAIPPDINKMQTLNLSLAVEWRQVTRTAFTNAFGQGFQAQGFYRLNQDGQNYGVYLLKRK